MAALRLSRRPGFNRVWLPGPVEILLARPTRTGRSGPWARSSWFSIGLFKLGPSVTVLPLVPPGARSPAHASRREVGM